MKLFFSSPSAYFVLNNQKKRIDLRYCLSSSENILHFQNEPPPITHTHTHRYALAFIFCTSCIQPIPVGGAETQGHRDF